MTLDRGRVLGELPLPLGPGAGELDAVQIAIAVEDACGLTLPDEVIDTAHLGRRDAIEAVLHSLPGSG